MALAAAGLCAACAPLALGQQFLGANFTGGTFSDSGFVPPDTMGAVGVDHFVEMINGRFSVYRKTDGVRVQSSTLNSFWTTAGISVSTFAFDPRILYDPYSKRWFASAADAPGAANSFLIGVSNSSDPTAGWKAFKIDSDADNSHTADFPMLGFNGNSVVVSANMFPIGAGSLRNNVVVIPKADLLLPVPTVANKVSFEDMSQLASSTARFPAVDMDNSNSLLGVLSSIIPVGQIQRVTAGLNGGVGTFNASTLTYSVPFVSEAPSGDQPGAKMNLDVGDSRFRANPVQHDGSIWAVASIASGGRSAIQWYRLSALGTAVQEQGIISDPQLYLMEPSIAINDLGDVVIGFSATGPNAGQFASTYYVAGKNSGGTTTFGAITQTHAGAAEYQILDTNNRNRWGDYSATTPDPADPSIFWSIQQFAAAPAAGTDQWGNRVTEIILPQPNEVRWKDANGGIFDLGLNWLGGAEPISSSHVIFSRSTLPLLSGYNVTVLSSQSVNRLSVRQGFVTLSLVGQTLTATNADINQPSLTIGEFGGSPSLLLMGGTFAGTNASIAPSSISTGGLVLSSAILNLSGTLKIGPAGSLTAATGGASVGRAAALDLASTAKINLADSDMIIDYTGGSPLNSIFSLIQQGYAGGSWNGNGIKSSRAATSPNAGESGKTALGFGEAAALGIANFDGFPTDSTTVLVKYTYVGDASLVGQVDVADLGILASHWQSAALWSGGDFDFNGTVDVNDLGLLATNWQVGVGNPLGPGFADALAALGLPEVSVPEPALIGTAVWTSLLLRRRIRGSSPPPRQRVF
jgi:hypothetical protein